MRRGVIQTGLWSSLAIALLCAPARAEKITDYDKIADKARELVIEKFGKFTQDKNVMGKPKKPDGSDNAGGPKTRFDKDSGITYVSEYTYHKNSFAKTTAAFDKKTGARLSDEEVKKKKAAGKEDEVELRRTKEFVSEHGGLSEAGGSSELERGVFEIDKKLSEQDKQKSLKDLQDDEKKEGITEDGIFRKERRDVQVKNDPTNPSTQNSGTSATGKPPTNPASAANPAQQKPDEEVTSTFRVTLREEAKEAIEQIGTKGYDSVKKAARDDDKQDDNTSVSNGLLNREAAARAYLAWRNESLAALEQRKLNDVLSSEGRGDLGKIEANEDFATCESAIDNRLNEVLSKDPKMAQDAQQKLRETAQKQKDMCKQVTALDFRQNNPKFGNEEGDAKGTPEKLLRKGVEREDGIMRDLRNQIEVLDRVGVDPNSLPTNWEYDESATRQKIAVEFGEGGQVVREENWTPKEQLDSYNAQVRRAEEAYEKLAQQVPQLQLDAKGISKYQIEAGKLPAWEVSKIPDQIKFNEYGVKPNPQPEAAPLTYDELLKAVQK